MRITARLRSLWWNLVRRREVDAALDEELGAYVELLAQEHQRAGMHPGDALRAARIETGGVEQVKEATRDAWVGRCFTTLSRDVRHSVRSLVLSPAYAITAVLTLAVGIAGATAVFTIVNGTLLKPLPAVADQDHLVDIETALPGGATGDMSYPDFADLRDNAHTLSGLTVYNGTSITVRDAAGPGRAMVNYVSGEFFSVLGVHASLGRLLEPRDVVPHGINPVVVVSYRYWQDRLHADRNVIGTTLWLDDYPLTIIGVAPPRFIGAMNLYWMDLWIPITMLDPVTHEGDPISARGDGWFRATGRLAPGRTAADAQRELSVIMARLSATYREDRGRGIRVFTGAGLASYDRDDEARLPRLLGIAVALLLLIACANVASLALIRAAARRRELATRLALGASRASLATRQATEGVIVAAAAACLGVIVARVLVRSAALVQTVTSMPEPDLSLDARVLAVALGAAILTAVVVSLIPVVHVAGVPAAAVLKDGASGAVRRRSRGQRLLVSGQIAASLVLLGAAAIVFNTAHKLLAVNTGFVATGVSSTLVDPHQAHVDSGHITRFYRDVIASARANPAVASAAVTSTVPPQEWSTREAVFREGEAPPLDQIAGHDLEFPVRPYIDFVSPALFDVLRIPLLRGRAFTDADDEHAARVVIVSSRLARALWPGQDAIGRQLVWPKLKGAPRPPLRVVGVAADIMHASLADAEPPLVMYVPTAQEPTPGGMFLLLRSRSGSTVPASVVRQIIASVAPAAAVHAPVPLTSHIADQVVPQRRASAWIGVFGLIALLLAAIGLYGVVAQGVHQRTRELAVRSALGATAGEIARMVVGEGLRVSGWGAAFGLAASLAGIRVLRTQLEGVGGFDVRAMSVAAGLLGFVMLAACWLPARRAARLDPIASLRSDG